MNNIRKTRSDTISTKLPNNEVTRYPNPLFSRSMTLRLPNRPFTEAKKSDSPPLRDRFVVPSSKHDKKNEKPVLMLIEKKEKWIWSFETEKATGETVNIKNYLFNLYQYNSDSDELADRMANAQYGSSDVKSVAVSLYESLSKNYRKRLIKDLIQAEFRKCSSKKDSKELQGALLRGDSLAAKIMVVHLKPLLVLSIDHITKKALQKLRKACKKQHLELNETKLEASDSLKLKKYIESRKKQSEVNVREQYFTKRRTKLNELVNTILEKTLEATVRYTHPSVKEIFRQLETDCKNFFPDIDNLAYEQITGIFFLRILNPSIVTSPIKDSLKKDIEKARFASVAVMISRIIQFTASETTVDSDKLPEYLKFAFKGTDYEMRKKYMRQIVSNLMILQPKIAT